ncbi:MAG: LamG domain-containing protein, partial [Actinobacteria bacterium]|nr:LamG domain-containing protein [Actinomycetota bacterium]
MKKQWGISVVLVACVLFFGTVSRVSAVNGGSVSFNGSNQYLSVPGSADWAVGTGDFTVEWFQYFQNTAGANARVFQVGSWPNASIGVSIEGETIYVWLASAWRLSVPSGTILNQWVHFAVTRSGTTLRVFKNGTEIGSGTNASNVTDSTTEFRIGAETYFNAYFGGHISNFHFVKGTALYTAPFWPAGPITPVANSKLLLNMTD